MKIAAFLKLKNENKNGNLIRCLNNCKQWANEIFIYDDYSTDESQKIYLDYTYKDNIIFDKFRDRDGFKNEIYKKQELLKFIQNKYSPDWIGWLDGDAIFDRELTCNLPSILENLESNNNDGLFCHYINLWRSETYYRIDNLYNNLDICCLWKNTKKLKFKPEYGLHQLQYPQGMNNIIKLNYENIHYGFYTLYNITRKYFLYKEHGQTGWNLDRLINEDIYFRIKKIRKEIFPLENIPNNYENDVCPYKKN